MDSISCAKCGGMVDKKTGRCLTCGYSTHSGAITGRSSSRTSFLGRLIMIVAALGGLFGMLLTWASFNTILHSGYDVISGSLLAVINDPELADASSLSSIDLTRLFLTCFVVFNLIILAVNLSPWFKIRVTISTILLLLFLGMDFFLLMLLNSIPAPTSLDMLYLDGKGYHISVFSLFFGSMGALVNLFFPRLPKY